MLGTTLIQVPAWGTVTLVEGLWLLAGFGALAFTMSHVRPLYDDLLTAKFEGRPELVLVAGGYLRREVIRLVQSVCLCVIGVYAAFEPSAIGNYVTLVGLVLTGVLLALGFLVGVQSWWDWRTRDHVQRLIATNGGGK